MAIPSWADGASLLDPRHDPLQAVLAHPVPYLRPETILAIGRCRRRVLAAIRRRPARDGARRLALEPALRRQAAEAPTVPRLRALGEVADRAAVPLLVSVLANRPELRLAALQSLGEIGGDEARAALREAIEVPLPPPLERTELRVAHRALAGCATEDDERLFLAAAEHADWYVRLAAVDGLRRMTRPTAIAALARLAGDPVQAVANRALAALQLPLVHGASSVGSPAG
jgi:HEAT repeat protein